MSFSSGSSKTNLPGGGYNLQAGVQAGPAWGSVSQDFNKKGLPTSPVNIGLGAEALCPQGHGVSGQINQQLGVGGQASLRGQMNLLQTESHRVDAWAQHDRLLDRNLKIVGPPTNSIGVNYNHESGLGAFASGAKTPGFPAVGTVGTNVPLFKSDNGNTRLDLGGSTTFGSGFKPQHQVGLQFTKRF